MRKPEDFATAEHALHASAIPSLVRCSWKTLMTFLMQPDGESGEAADTGSAVHQAIHEFHKNTDAAAAIEAMTANIGKYRRADLNDAAAMFLQYQADPRNRQAQIEASEESIEIRLAPAPEDKTQKEIVIVGRLDQIRRIDTGLRLYDAKSSKKKGWILVQQHMYQMATYSVGATIKFKEPVRPGALIRTRSYEGREGASQPPGVFWNYNLTLQQCYVLMDHLRHIIASVRNGKPLPSPHDDWCEWCPASSIDTCMPLLEDSVKNNFTSLKVIS
jgi:hypothetical protein